MHSLVPFTFLVFHTRSVSVSGSHLKVLNVSQNESRTTFASLELKLSMSVFHSWKYRMRGKFWSRVGGSKPFGGKYLLNCRASQLPGVTILTSTLENSWLRSISRKTSMVASLRCSSDRRRWLPCRLERWFGAFSKRS